MNEIQDIAIQWLNDKQVDVVIGYAEGSAGRVRTCFATDASEAQQFIYDNRCKQNLANYLTKQDVKKMGKVALVATVPVMRSVMILVSEFQIDASNIRIIGVGQQNEVMELIDMVQVELYLKSIDIQHPADEKALIEELKKMSLEERFAFWQKELSRCIKCYACRAGCPMCYCTRCAAECNQPQWISVPSHIKGNHEWHVLRAMHLAGRCISCGECSRNCPMGIPVAVLPMYLADVMSDAFGSKPGIEPNQVATLSTYCLGDKEHFIR